MARPVSVRAQLARLLDLGVGTLAGISDTALERHTEGLPDDPGGTLIVHPSLVPASALASLLLREGKPGFVVHDLTDLAEFGPIADVPIPDRALYLVRNVDRGDDLRNWSPNEALPAITERGRTPLTINEGICWLLQEPELLEPNYCFMTVASRKVKGKSLDARTPAIWISGGTGHDGKANAGAPKVGWCWAGNRHTWLGFASAADRVQS